MRTVRGTPRAFVTLKKNRLHTTYCAALKHYIISDVCPLPSASATGVISHANAGEVLANVSAPGCGLPIPHRGAETRAGSSKQQEAHRSMESRYYQLSNQVPMCGLSLVFAVH